MEKANRLIRQISLLGLAVFLVGCNREQPVAQAPPVEVIISQPILEKIADWDAFTGTVEAKESVDIRARVRGEIKAVPFTEGDEVPEKKLLFVIDDDPFQADLKQAKGQLAAWTAKLKAAEEKIAIYKPLAEKGTVSKEELVQAIGAKGDAIGGIETANGKIMEAEINIKYCKIQAPIAGKIGQALLSKGNIANATGQDNQLTSIVSIDPLYVYFHVNERALLNYQKLRRAQFEKDKKPGKLDLPVEMALATDTDFPHKGVLDFIDNKVDPSTGAIKVRARFDNPKGDDGRRSLTPGLFARIKVSVAEPYPAVLIADRAILSDQSLKYVLVVNKEKNNVVERVDIVPAHRVQDDGLRAVESGLKGSDWVIIDGMNRVRPAAIVKPTEEKMPRRPTTRTTKDTKSTTGEKT